MPLLLKGLVPIDVFGKLKGKEVLVRDTLGGERYGVLRQWDDRIVELSAKERAIFVRRSHIVSIEEDGADPRSLAGMIADVARGR